MASKGPAWLAKILTLSEVEIDLEESLRCLSEAVGLDSAVSHSRSNPACASTAEDRGTSRLAKAILTGEEYHGPITAMAMRYLKAGMPDAQVVLTLRGIMEAVPEAIRNIKCGVPQLGRWQARYDDIPRAVESARAKLQQERGALISEVSDVARYRLDCFTKVR